MRRRHFISYLKHFTKLRVLSAGSLAALVVSLLGSGLGIAHAAAKASYTVMAGTAATEVGIDILAFVPQTLKVHRGDSITFKYAPVHNVRFTDTPDPNLIAPQNIDGQQIPALDPLVANPSAQSGDPLKPGLNTGILGDPSGPTDFTVVADLPAGTYNYHCDLHPGMVASIVVVDDSTSIPTPDQVSQDAQKEMANNVANSELAYIKQGEVAQTPVIKGGSLQIQAGATSGPGTVERFFPQTGVIQEGQSVTWTVAAGLEPHTVNFNLPLDGNIPPTLNVITDKKGIPWLVPANTFLPTVKSGDSYTGADVGSGELFPAQSFTLKFPKAGVYHYFCAIHPGHIGTIVVLPAGVSNPLVAPAAPAPAGTAAAAAPTAAATKAQ